MNLLSLDEHRMLFHAMQKIPQKEQVDCMPERSILERHGIDVRLFVKWHANRPKNCPNCDISDQWSIGGEEDVLYSCMNCFTDIYLEKSIASHDFNNIKNIDQPHQSKRVEDEVMHENRSVTEYLDIFLAFDCVATSFLESNFCRNSVPFFTTESTKSVSRIPWKIFSDVANSFCVLCELENVGRVSWNFDSPKIWCIYYTIVQGVSGLSFDHLRRLLRYANLYRNTSLVMSDSEPYYVHKTDAHDKPLPLIQWLYMESHVSYSSISIHDIRSFSCFHQDKIPPADILDKEHYVQQTQVYHTEGVAQYLRFIGLGEWTPHMGNPICITLLNNIFYFFEFPEKFINPIMPITAYQVNDEINTPTIEWQRDFYRIDVSEEQKICCFLLLFFQHLQKFPPTAHHGDFYKKLSNWLKEWQKRVHLESTVSKPEVFYEIFPEPHLNLLMEILAVVSCTPMHRLVYLVFLIVSHVHSIFGPDYTKEILYRIKRYLVATRPSAHREYGDICAPITVLSKIFENSTLLHDFEKEFYRDQNRNHEPTSYIHRFDEELFCDSLTRLNSFRSKKTRKKVNGVDESNAFLLSGIHSRNASTTMRLFFERDSDTETMEFLKHREDIIYRNISLIKQVFSSCCEIVFTHHYTLELTGLSEIDACIFMQLPSSFIARETYIKKLGRIGVPEGEVCSCGHMICFRSFYPNTNYVISWFIYECQWKILRIRDPLEYSTQKPLILSALRQKSSSQTSFVMCEACRNTRLHTSGEKDYPADTLAKFIFDREFEVVATTIGRYNSNTAWYSPGGNLDDMISFPMYAVTDAETWDNDIHIALHEKIHHIYYPPLPEVLYPLTLTDILTSRQRILEWLLFSLFPNNELYNGFNRDTASLKGCTASEKLSSSALHRYYEKQQLCTKIKENYENILSYKSREPPYVAINQLLDVKRAHKADVVDKNELLSKLINGSKFPLEWRDFFAKLSMRHRTTSTL